MSVRRWIMVGLMVLGVIAGLPQLGRRMRVESAARRVSLVAAQPSFVGLAETDGIPPVTLLKRMRAVGVGALGVSESTLGTLTGQGRLTVLTLHQWETAVALQGKRGSAAALPGSLPAFFARHAHLAPPASVTAPTIPLPSGASHVSGTVILADQALATWLPRALGQAMAGSGVPVRSFTWRGRTGVYVGSPEQAILGLPLGFAPGAFALARAAGMRVVPRPVAAPLGPGAAAQLYSRMARARVPVEAVLFAGNPTTPLPGYPQAIPATARTFQQHQWLLGLLETPEQLGNVDQPGTKTLAAALGEHAVRVYSVPPWILADSPSGVASAIFSQVTDFNIRLVYLHPLLGTQPVAGTLSAVTQAVAQLRSDGYRFGQPRSFALIQVGRGERVVQGLAVVAAGLLLLELLIPPVARYGYQPLVVLGALVGLFCLGSSHLSVPVVGLGAALAGGGLAVVYFARSFDAPRWPAHPRLGYIWRRTMGVTLTMAGISFCGALVIASLMGSTAFFLEWSYFRGVKLTFVGIPIVAALAFLAYVGTGAVRRAPDSNEGFPLWREFKAVWAEPVRVKYVAAFLLVAAVGAIYLIRSGNAPAAFVPGFEVRMRNLLQSVFTYRPREKDFLVGYPSALVAGFFAARRRRWPFFFFLLGASVGQVSLIDSFATLRTPFIHSVLREGWGMVLGMALGTIALVALQILEPFVAQTLWSRPTLVLDPSGLGVSDSGPETP